MSEDVLLIRRVGEKSYMTNIEPDHLNVLMKVGATTAL